MSAYNLQLPDHRAQLRADRQAELDAIREGRWPRDINDALRWSPPNVWIVNGQIRAVTSSEWAAHMCQIDIRYCDTYEMRHR